MAAALQQLALIASPASTQPVGALLDQWRDGVDV